MRQPRFDAKRPLVAARDFTFMGVEYKAGAPFGPFDEGTVSRRMIERQYEARAVNMGDAEAVAADPVQMVPGPKNGSYTITAPWLPEPEVVRGKVNAEKRLAALRETGAPLGFIEGGSVVTVEGGEGGWYEVNAPWLDEPEKVQGREAAEQRQREIHDAGEPDTHHGVTLTAGENGWYSLTRDGAEGELKIQGEDNAREAAAKLRAGETIEGQPAEWAPAEEETTDEETDEEQPDADSDVEGAGNDAPEDETVDDTNKDKDQRDVDTAPNEPDTNEPNGAEVINDKANAEGAGKDGDGGDGGTARPVGP